MNPLLAIAACAVLFAAFGLLQRRRRHGCDSCGVPCVSREREEESKHGHA